jgi:hypothetical protein
MGRARCEFVTSKPEGIGLLLGLCDGLFAHGEGGSGDICGCGHSGWRKRGKGSMEKWTIELKYIKAYTTRRDVPLPPDSLLLLRISVQAHISRIRLSLLTIFTSTASYPIYHTGPNTSPFQIPNILSAHLSQILIDDTILPVIPPRHVTNSRWTSFTHHFRRSNPSHRRSVRRCYARNSASSRASVTANR